MSDEDENYLEDELEKFVASGLNDEEDPEYKAEIGEVFKAIGIASHVLAVNHAGYSNP